MKTVFLDFEQPIAELEGRRSTSCASSGDDSEINISDEIERLKDKSEALTRNIFSSLTSWQVAQVARHPDRPYTLDYIRLIFAVSRTARRSALRRRSGDRRRLARLDGQSVMVIGHQKGRDTKENIKRNFGMPHPEGYRKALRLMQLAERFHAAGRHLDRHAGRLSRTRRRGARPVGGDRRATSSRCRCSPTPIIVRRDRRRRLRRRARARASPIGC